MSTFSAVPQEPVLTIFQPDIARVAPEVLSRRLFTSSPVIITSCFGAVSAVACASIVVTALAPHRNKYDAPKFTVEATLSAPRLTTTLPTEQDVRNTPPSVSITIFSVCAIAGSRWASPVTRNVCHNPKPDKFPPPHLSGLPTAPTLPPYACVVCS